MLDKEVRARMRKLKLYEKDIKETFVRSSGPGGQNVNKVSTCVHLQHIPSGIQVKCQRERTQVQNRSLARCLLIEKIEKKERKKAFDKKSAAAKRRRQNRKRTVKSKEKTLKAKRIHSEKKSFRHKVSMSKVDEF